MEGPTRYTLIVEALDSENALARQILIDHLGYHQIDLQRTARHLPGILARDLFEDRALALKQELEDAACRAVITPTESLPDVEHTPAQHHVRCVDSGLVVLDLNGEVGETIPWLNLYYISIGSIPYEMSSHSKGEISLETFQITGVHDALVKSHPKAHEMWIAVQSPDRVLRFDEHVMNYEYLNERKTTSGPSNFKLFVNDIIKCAPHVMKSKTAAEFLTTNSILKSNFNSAEDFRNQVQAEIVLARDALMNRQQ